MNTEQLRREIKRADNLALARESTEYRYWIAQGDELRAELSRRCPPAECDREHQLDLFA